MRWRRSVAFLFLAAVSSGAIAADGPPSPAAPPSPPAAPQGVVGQLAAADRATLGFLQHLGWRVVEDPAATAARIVEGQPGTRASLDAARLAGDLVLVVPTTPSPDALASVARSVQAAADGVGSRLAWLHRLQPAGEAALARLAAAAERGTYDFPSVIGITSPIFAFTPPAGLWRDVGNGAYVPRGSPAAAIAAFTTASCLAECLVGQEVATLSTQLELLGPTLFDEAYAGDGATVGRLDGYQASPIGRALATPGQGGWQCLLIPPAEVGTADPGVLLAKHGPLAFAGFTGFLHDQTGADRANENVVIVSVTAAAAEALRTRGGFPAVAALTKEALELRLAERKPFMTAARLDPIRARQRELETDPLLTGIRVYIHPHGVRTLGEIAAKHRGKNKSALELFPYVSAREDHYYRRYRDVIERRLLQGLPLR